MSTLDAATRPRGLRAQIREFFYAPEVPYGTALLRISLPIALLFAMVPRWSHARELYSSDGAPVMLWTAYNTVPLIPPPSGEAAVIIHTIVILTLVTTCFGWCTRVSLILATSGYVYLNVHDIIGTMNKYSVIATHLMFLMSFSHCGTVWSIDSWLRRSRLRRAGVPPELADRRERFPAWTRRLLQLFMGAVYIGAAVTKLHIPTYFTGEQLQTWMITEYNVPNLLGSRFALHPSVLVIFALICLLWEVLFIFLAWRGIGRIVMIATGTIFHLMTLLTLGLFVFPMVCISSYLAFLNEKDVEALRPVFARWRERGRGVRAAIGRLLRPRELGALPAISPAWSYGAFAFLTVFTAAGGLAAEYKLDPYGIRRPEGPYTLKELDRDYVEERLAPTERIRNEDKVLLFDVGSIVLGGAVLDRRTQFRQGETVRAQCGLVPPHEDIWVECNLHDSENRVVDTIGVFAASDAMRTIFYYTIGDCTLPGDYSLVLKISGEEIMRRPITILPRTGAACSAN